MKPQMAFLFFFIFLFSANSYASCPGMSGEAALRCNCHEVHVGLAPEAFTCVKHSDCVTVEGYCADWAIANADYIKTHKVIFKNMLPKLKFPPKPEVSCRQNTCMRSIFVQDNEKNYCDKNKGQWVKLFAGQGKYECILANPDFGKSCKDSADCNGNSCVVTYAENEAGEFWKDPKGNCSDKFQLIGKCYLGTKPYYGCHWFLEAGKCQNLCLD